ncbi:cytochrome P450 [Pluteus cervinus]|uniref:Cytochrome P450 n=1 Tax=Pluteus cervinus TaxID=181527 RepID=A0ACD3BAF9_9AGAR|nr:cytochrome P450 [Pluteus cervinus]
MAYYLPLAVCTSLLVVFYFTKVRQDRRRLPFPPGPKPWPLIGNVLDIPTSTSWYTYTKWSKIYNSNMLYVNPFGQKLLILNSFEDAEELMDVRSANSSGRPFNPMMQLIGLDAHTAFMGKTPLWRKHRTMLRQSLGKQALIRQHHVFEKKVAELVHKIATDPGNFRGHCKAYGPAIAMDVFYGYDLVDNDDPLLIQTLKVVDQATDALLPGVFLVNTFPFLRYLPRWFPGAGFHDRAADTRRITVHIRDTPFDRAVKNLSQGVGRPSIVTEWLRQDKVDEDCAKLAKDVAIGALEAVIETTSATLDAFCLALTLNPEVQKIAQEEIRQVVGTTVLPTLRDRPFMPYLEAIYRETLRWAPPTPLGVPHTTAEDDVYNGYLIPAGTVVVANIWAMTRNEKKYPEPEAFRPGRFLDPDGTLNHDDRVLTFGFGRRICAGKDLASEIVWLAMANILATFNISKANDENGNEIEVLPKFIGEAVSHPAPFECAIKLRRELEGVL